jgi:hypothetical protein
MLTRIARPGLWGLTILAVLLAAVQALSGHWVVFFFLWPGGTSFGSSFMRAMMDLGSYHRAAGFAVGGPAVLILLCVSLALERVCARPGSPRSYYGRAVRLGRIPILHLRLSRPLVPRPDGRCFRGRIGSIPHPALLHEPNAPFSLEQVEDRGLAVLLPGKGGCRDTHAQKTQQIAEDDRARAQHNGSGYVSRRIKFPDPDHDG